MKHKDRPQLKLKIDGAEIEQVKSLVYPGKMITAEGSKTWTLTQSYRSYKPLRCGYIWNE